MIKEDRLLKQIACFFSDPSALFVEIAQNAQRSGATTLDITLKDRVLTATDNGHGADRAEPLFVLADTGWEKELAERHNAAGWGVYFLFSVAREISFRSLFGSVAIDSQRFLTDKPYRETVLGRVNRNDTCEGFSLKLTLLDTVELIPRMSQLEYFPLTITFNGEEVVRKHSKDEDYIFTTKYLGNFVGVTASIFGSVGNAYVRTLENAAEPLVIWYGIKIPCTASLHRHSVVLDVTKGSPVTPVLPFREKVKRDDAWKNFLAFVRDETAKYCVRYINNRTNTSAERLAERMKFLVDYGTQKHLDSLVRFYLIQSEPHSDSDWPGRQTVLLWKGKTKQKNPRIEHEVLTLVVDGEEIDGEDAFIALPPGVVTARKVTSRQPAWLSVRQRTIHVDVTTDKSATYQGHYFWAKSAISCRQQREVAAVAVVGGWGDGAIYYAAKAADFRDEGLDDYVFEKVMSDERDSDAQHDEFAQEVGDDIQNIVGSYELGDLLKGFWTARISPYAIRGITWRPGTDKVKITTEDGEKELALYNPPVQQAA